MARSYLREGHHAGMMHLISSVTIAGAHCTVDRAWNKREEMNLFLVLLLLFHLSVKLNQFFLEELDEPTVLFTD